MEFVCIWLIILALYLFYKRGRLSINISDLKILKRPIIYALICTIFACILWKFYRPNEIWLFFVTFSLMSFSGFLTLFYVLHTFSLFWKKYKKDKRKTSIKNFNSDFFIILLVLLGLLVSVHVNIFRPMIETEKFESFTGIGYMTSGNHVYYNGTYTRIVNFSLKNTYSDALNIVEFAVKFKDMNNTHLVTDYYPKTGLVYNECTSNEIYYMWDVLKTGETAFLVFSYSWNKSDGDATYNPVDLSPESTYVQINDGYDVKWIRRP